jgi:hypothetical protein
VDEVLEDPVIGSILENEKDIGFLLVKANESVETIFNLKARQWVPGHRLLLFLEIEALLQDVFTGYVAADIGQGFAERVLCGFFRGRDPVFLRASLFNCLELLSATTVCGFFEAGMIEAFRRLADWFGLSRDIIPA